jgi:hypothetical protein
VAREAVPPARRAMIPAQTPEWPRRAPTGGGDAERSLFGLVAVQRVPRQAAFLTLEYEACLL